MVHELACNRCGLKVSVMATRPHGGKSLSWEIGPVDVNTAGATCVSPPFQSCPHLQRTIMAVYDAGRLI
jgi:hypothetical protein